MRSKQISFCGERPDRAGQLRSCATVFRRGNFVLFAATEQSNALNMDRQDEQDQDEHSPLRLLSCTSCSSRFESLFSGEQSMRNEQTEAEIGTGPITRENSKGTRIFYADINDSRSLRFFRVPLDFFNDPVPCHGQAPFQSFLEKLNLKENAAKSLKLEFACPSSLSDVALLRHCPPGRICLWLFSIRQTYSTIPMRR